MVNLARTALVSIAVVVAVPGAKAAPCERRPAVAVEVGIREAPIIALDDLSLSDLQEMSAQSRRRPAHPVLGFYTGTVGYALRRVDIVSKASPTPDARPCPQLDVQAELVAVDRRIAVANELSAVPCRLWAATEHYRHHAAAASLALHQFAAKLSRQLELEMNQYLRRHADFSQAQLPALRQHVSSVLDHAVETFSGALVGVQASVDTPKEIHSLSAACSGT